MNLTKETAVTGVRKNKEGMVVAFNINRKTWGRGKRGGSLLEVGTDFNGKPQINMCCLGVFGRACGLSVKRLETCGMPADVGGKIPNSFGQFLELDGDNTKLAVELAYYNDKGITSDEVKEAKIIEGFAKIGVKVKFVGKG